MHGVEGVFDPGAHSGPIGSFRPAPFFGGAAPDANHEVPPTCEDGALYLEIDGVKGLCGGEPRIFCCRLVVSLFEEHF